MTFTPLGLNEALVASTIGRQVLVWVTFMFLLAPPVAQVLLSATRTWPALIAQEVPVGAHAQARGRMRVGGERLPEALDGLARLLELALHPERSRRLQDARVLAQGLRELAE